MKIKNLRLTNFRCFENFEIEFSEDYNIHAIIAENMVGKSALMAALKLSANTYTSGLKTESQIKDKDHRVIGNNPISDITADVSIETIALITDSNNNKIQSCWKKYKTKPKGERTKIEICDGLDPKKQSKITYKLAAEGKSILPLFSFIGTEYIHVESSETGEWEINGKSIDGYKGCFDDKSIKKFLFNWIKRIDSIIIEMNYKQIIAETYKDIPQNAITVFRNAVTALLPDIDIIEWSSDANQPIIKFKNGEIRMFGMLSDGYRYLILLAGELATRAFLLNKSYGTEILNKIHGIVLIDEFGIHLHPSLQNETLIRLGKTFPNVQFIISTHSPLILNGLKKEQVHILSSDSEGKRFVNNPDEDIIGLGADEIMTKIFGLATTYDHQFLELNEEYKELYKIKTSKGLTENQLQKFKQISEQLSKLRLDPEFKISEDDTITKIVKEKLELLKKGGKENLNTNDLSNKINEIIKKIFE